MRVLHLGEVPYEKSMQAMLDFNAQRNAQTPDELWVLSHPGVYTQGLSCDTLPTGNPDDIPVIKTDRGGQITYHGPGQIIIYCLLDIKRIGIGPKRLVQTIEQAIINCLASYKLTGELREGAPGVYVGGQKIAALGLRIRKGLCYHGLSLNYDLDLSPFDAIDPCGYADLEVTSMARLGRQQASEKQVAQRLCDQLKDLI